MKSSVSDTPDELDAVLDRASTAAKAFESYGRSEVDRIVRAVADVAEINGRQLAEKAANETGFGVFEHKVAKNEELSAGFVREYGELDLVGHRVDPATKQLLHPVPAGVVFAVTPSTSPVANLYFKVLSCLLTRNAVVISPHPAAVKTSVEAAKLLSDAATAAGAPSGAIQILDKPSVPLIESAMSDARVHLILATGGSAVVKAAYRSGTPAIGVGPGNAPVVVDASADLARAARVIVDSKSFDNSILCTAESVLLVVDSIAERLTEQLVHQGAHMCRPEETALIRKYMYPTTKFNTAVVGKSAYEIAQAAGVRVPRDTKLLVTPIDRIEDAESLTHEKLSPVLAMKTVHSFEEAISASINVVEIVGVGHSAVIHSEDPQHVLDFSARVPVQRIAVNIGGSLGNAGIGTGLAVTMSVGTGFRGGSSLGENLSPEHLIQWRRTAYPTNDQFPDFSSIRPSQERHNPVSPGLVEGELRDELRRLIVEELRGLIGQSHG